MMEPPFWVQRLRRDSKSQRSSPHYDRRNRDPPIRIQSIPQVLGGRQSPPRYDYCCAECTRWRQFFSRPFITWLSHAQTVQLTPQVRFDVCVMVHSFSPAFHFGLCRTAGQAGSARPSCSPNQHVEGDFAAGEAVFTTNHKGVTLRLVFDDSDPTLR